MYYMYTFMCSYDGGHFTKPSGSLLSSVIFLRKSLHNTYCIYITIKHMHACVSMYRREKKKRKNLMSVSAISFRLNFTNTVRCWSRYTRSSRNCIKGTYYKFLKIYELRLIYVYIQ